MNLVVFDLDGTLVDSARDIAASVNAALEQLAPASAPVPLERVVSFVGEGARVLIERVLLYQGLTLDADAVLPLYLRYYRERALETTRLYAGIEDALAAIAAAGWKLAVLTNKPGDLSRSILEGLGIAPRFARIWGADDAPARKPDPAGLLALLRELEAPAAEAWVVGDSPTDVETARAARVRIAGVLWGFDAPGVRAAAPDRLLENPRELVRLIVG